MENRLSPRSSRSSSSYTFSIPANLIRASVSAPSRKSSTSTTHPSGALIEDLRRSIVEVEHDRVKHRLFSLSPGVLESNVPRPSAVRTARPSRSHAAYGRSASVVAHNDFATEGESNGSEGGTQLAGRMDVPAEDAADTHVHGHGITEPPRVHKHTISFQTPDFSGSQADATLEKITPSEDSPPEEKDTVAPNEKVMSDRTCPQDTPRRSTFSRPDAGAHRRKASVAVKAAISGFITRERQSSIKRTYARAKLRQQEIQRSKPVQLFFRYAVYFLLLCLTYFVLVGRPLWGGTIWYAYVLISKRLTFVGGSGVFLGIAFL